MTTTQHIDELLTRSVDTLIDPDGRFRKKLETTPEQVVLKLGIDPTRPDLHLGHAVCLWKMRAMQDLGARVVLIVGDFTGRIGDPTGKSKTRPELEQAEIERNVATFLEQFGKILLIDKEHFSWIRNSDWFVNPLDVIAPDGATITVGDKSAQLPANSLLAKMAKWEETRMQPAITGGRVESVSLVNFLATLRQLTHARLIDRDMFQERLKAGDPLFMHEMMYPILQGLDSYVIHKVFGACDIEFGGTDQYFNNMMGRDIMEMNNQPPQAVMTLDILEGTDGKEKMSKSLDNYIGITDSPTDMFGKTMRIPDELILRWVTLATELDTAEFEKKLDDPRAAKVALAKAIIARYHSAEAADRAAEEFDRIFAGGGSGLPDDIPEITIEEGNWNIVELVKHAGLIESKSEIRRLIEGGGVKANGEKVASHETEFAVGSGELLIQVGKRKFAKIIAG